MKNFSNLIKELEKKSRSFRKKIVDKKPPKSYGN